MPSETPNLYHDDVLHRYEVQSHRQGRGWDRVIIEAPSMGRAVTAQDLPDIDDLEIQHLADCWCNEPDACAEHRAGCPQGAHGGTP